MYKKDYTKLLILSIITISLIARIVVLFALESGFKAEIWECEQIAGNLLSGKGLHYVYLTTEHRSTSLVLYPLFCATVYFFTKHSFLAVKILQIALSLLTCALIYKLLNRLFNRKAAIIGLGLLSFHPGLIVYSVRLHNLTLDAFLFTLSAYFLLPLFENRNLFRNGLLVGIAIGLTLLTRPSIGIFVPILLAIIFFSPADKQKTARYPIFGILAGIAMVLSFLIVRNYIVFHKVVVLPNDSGINFWTGNNPYTLGTANTLDGKSVLEKLPKEFIEKARSLNEFEQNKLFYNEAFIFIGNNPGRFIGLFIKKLYYFWWFTPTQGLNYPKIWLAFYKIYYSIILVFAMAGFFTALRKIAGPKKQMIYALALLCATVSLAQALYYVDGRHRWVIEPVILIFSAYGAKRWSGGLWKKLLTY